MYCKKIMYILIIGLHICTILWTRMVGFAIFEKESEKIATRAPALKTIIEVNTKKNIKINWSSSSCWCVV